MDGLARKPGDAARPPGATVAIIGGGFTGACLAYHLAQASGPERRILVFEPRAQLGLGLAYSTSDPVHRLNAPAARMSMLPDNPAHFSDWILASGACAADAQAALPDGRLFARRAVFGRYVAETLAPLLQAGRIVHVRAEVEELQRQGGAWSVRYRHGAPIHADQVVLATGHAPPAIPPALAPLQHHPRFIADPLSAGALRRVGHADQVLIIGTGLTMADSVAALYRNGHTAPILAVSRRGQLPHPHAPVERPAYRNGLVRAETAGTLLRHVRASVAIAAEAGLPWQSVFDGLRCDAQPIWAALPAAERRRLWRHARPFWDTHRHRLPPSVAEILDRRLADGGLVVRAAGMAAAEPAGDAVKVWLQPPRALAITATVDWVVLATGACRVADSGGGLVGRLLAAGIVALDETGHGLRCGSDGRAAGQATLYVIGPPARGSFADVTGVPEIAHQAVLIARRLATAPSPAPALP